MSGRRNRRPNDALPSGRLDTGATSHTGEATFALPRASSDSCSGVEHAEPSSARAGRRHRVAAPLLAGLRSVVTAEARPDASATTRPRQKREIRLEAAGTLLTATARRGTYGHTAAGTEMQVSENWIALLPKDCPERRLSGVSILHRSDDAAGAAAPELD